MAVRGVIIFKEIILSRNKENLTHFSGQGFVA